MGDWNESIAWRVEGCEIFGNDAAGIYLSNGIILRKNLVHHNGQIGLLGRGNGALIENNEIAYNNTSGVDPSWEAGGMKFFQSDGIIFRNNYVHHNQGSGVWFDINDTNGLIQGNRVEDNTHEGIFYEVSYSGTIEGNVVRRNGLGTSNRYGGIVVSASSDVTVTGNTLEGNGMGIMAVQADRSSVPVTLGPHLVTNLWVHGNHVTQDQGATGFLDQIGDSAIATRLNNRFDGNTYYLSGNANAFSLPSGITPPAGTGGANVTATQWQSAGFDRTSTMYH
jgi:parallel beta-helix repeat protein